MSDTIITTGTDGKVISIAHSDKQSDIKEGEKKTAFKKSKEKAEQIESNVPAKAVTSKPAAPEFKLELLKTSRKVALVPLSSLVALDSTPIPDAKEAMRETDKQHLEHLYLALKAGAKFPPLKGVQSNYGFVVLNGYHRWGAYARLLEEMTPADKLEEATKTLMIEVEPLNGLTFEEIIDVAFSDNEKNGLPTSDKSRSRYALWLLKMEKAKFAIGQGPKPSVQRCAERAKVSRMAVYQMMKRDEGKKNGKMIDAIVSDEKEVEEIRATLKEADDAKAAKSTAVDPFTRETRNFARAIREIVKIEDNFTNLVNMFLATEEFKTNDINELTVMTRALANLQMKLNEKLAQETASSDSDEEELELDDDEEGPDGQPED